MNPDHYHQALGRGSTRSWSADAGHKVNLEVPHHWPRSWSPPPGPRLPSFKSSSTPQHCLLRLQTPSRAITTHSLWLAQETEEFASHLGNFKGLTVFSALRVVSSREAATQPSSVEPPSHIPAKAAMLLWRREEKTAEQTFQPLVLRAQLQPRPNSTTICAIKPRVLRPASALILNIFFCFSAVHYLLTEKEKCYSHSSPFVFLPMLYQYLDFSFEGVNNLKLSARMVI